MILKCKRKGGKIHDTRFKNAGKYIVWFGKNTQGLGGCLFIVSNKSSPSALKDFLIGLSDTVNKQWLVLKGID